MSKAEKFIEEHIRTCSNQYDFPEYFENGIKRLKEYQPWLSPDQARRAVEIAREEVKEKACNWLQFHYRVISGGEVEDFIWSLKQAMRDE